MRARLRADHASPIFLKLHTLLTRYASVITVDSILASACARAQVTPAHVDSHSLERLLQELQAGIRIFCKAEQVPEVMADLASLMRRRHG